MFMWSFCFSKLMKLILSTSYCLIEKPKVFFKLYCLLYPYVSLFKTFNISLLRTKSLRWATEPLVLGLFVPHLSFFWCFGKTMLRDHNENMPIQIYLTHSISYMIACTSSKDLPHPCVIRAFAVRRKTLWIQGHLQVPVKTLIRLHGCAGWSESSLGSHGIL